MTWNGATLFKSVDAGSTYDAVLSLANAASIGAATTALGDFSGGNIFDEINTVVVALRCGAPLVSYNELQVLNGSGLCVIGAPGRWEVMQYKTATIIGPSIYRLSGLLRGRRGTEWAIRTHAAGDVFVLASLTAWSRINSGTSEIGLPRLYKGVTSRASASTTAAQAFTNSAVGLECYAPVHLGFGRDTENNLTLSWIRRTRIGGEWRDNVDVPLGEDFEHYVVEVLDNSYTEVIRVSPTLAAPTWVYTAAEQTEDFGELYDNPHFKIYQISANHGRGSALFGSPIPDGAVPAPELPYVPELPDPEGVYGDTYGPWKKLDNMSEARTMHVAFVVGDRILHAAGTHIANGFIRNDGNQMWLDPATGGWEFDTTDSLPIVGPIEAQLTSATTFAYDGTYYAIGRSVNRSAAQVFEYDPNTIFGFGSHWRYRTDIVLNWDIRDQYGALVGSKVYYPTVGFAVDMDGGAITSIASIKALLGYIYPRSCTAEVDGLIYLLGVGDLWVSGATCVKTYIYDPETDTLSSGADCPQPLWGATSVVLDGKIHVIGGAVGNQSFIFSDRHLVYDPATNTWTTKASLPPVLYISDGSVQFGNTYNSSPGRAGLSAVAYDGKIYLAGGYGFIPFEGGSITGANVSTPYIQSYIKLTLEYDPNLDT